MVLAGGCCGGALGFHRNRSRLDGNRIRATALDHLQRDAHERSRHANAWDCSAVRNFHAHLPFPLLHGSLSLAARVHEGGGASPHCAGNMMYPEHVVAGFLLLALIFYAITGGADLGGGMWDLLATGQRAKEQRRAIARAIGPIWEANHVWLILAVVILFTAFPWAFAGMMTALNIPITMMLVGVIFRGCAFIFRKYDSRAEEVQNR